MRGVHMNQILAHMVHLVIYMDSANFDEFGVNLDVFHPFYSQ